MKASRFPHSLALIFSMIVLAQLLTYVIPAGTYDQAVKETPLAAADRALAIPAGAIIEPGSRRIWLPDGRRADLPDGVILRFATGEDVPLGDRARVGSAQLPPSSMLRWGDQEIYLPPGSVLDLPASKPVQIRDGVTGFELTTAGNLNLPAAAFTKQQTRSIIAGSYHRIPDPEPQPWYSTLYKILLGLTDEDASQIIFFVFLVGGVIAVFRATGAIDALIGAAIRTFGSNRPLLVGGMVTLFAAGSSTVGMAEEYMPFIPVLVAMSLALKLDAIVAMGIVYIGAGVGYGCAMLNPFTVMIAKDIAYEGVKTDLNSGWEIRTGLLILCIGIGVHHILRYARKITADPSKSLVADIAYSKEFDLPEDVSLTGRRLLVLLIGAAVIVTFVIALQLGEDWYIKELSALFLGATILAALVARLSPNEVCQRFCHGAAEMTTTALLIGFARTIEIMLKDAQVVHTIVHGIATALNAIDIPAVSANGMLLMQSICNFLIPSGSGQAYVTMPIMAPVAQVTGLGRETAILAYQFGDGFTNMIVPTNGLLMGMLALGRIPYQRWVRFIFPLLIKIYLVAAIALAIAAQFQWGSNA